MGNSSLLEVGLQCEQREVEILAVVEFKRLNLTVNSNCECVIDMACSSRVNAVLCIGGFMLEEH